MFGRNRQEQRHLDVAMVQAQKISALKDLVDKNQSDLREALSRIGRDDPSTHDWRAEASGLAWMICEIHDKYLFSKQLGGDSEFLANAIQQAYSWVDGPLREFYETAQDDGDIGAAPLAKDEQ